MQPAYPLGTKRCSVCMFIKVLEEFHKNKNTKDGHTNTCKPCAIAKTKAWERNNRERKNARARVAYANDRENNLKKDRAYRELNRAKDRAYKAIYYQRNKEQQSAYYKEKRKDDPNGVRANNRDRWEKWNARHPGRANELNKASRQRLGNDPCVRVRWRARWRAYRWANLDKVKTYQRKWVKKNPEKMALYTQERRAREVNAHGNCTPKQLQARIAYYGSLCWVCQKPYTAIDHVVALARGGTNWPANLRPICLPCNSSKRDKSPLDFLRTRAQTSL